MRKIAFFVEGNTEAEFIEKTLEKICSAHNITFEHQVQFKNTLQPNSKKLINSIPDSKYLILIANCSNDAQVNTQILKNAASLINEGYSHIIGIRDLYPDHSISDLQKLSLSSQLLFSKFNCDIRINFAIHEVESWFIDEITHFQRIEPTMTVVEINNRAGIDLTTVNGESIPNPADTLHDIYSKWNLAYHKTTKHIKRTVDALNYEEIYSISRQRSSSLDKFLNDLHNALGV